MPGHICKGFSCQVKLIGQWQDRTWCSGSPSISQGSDSIVKGHFQNALFPLNCFQKPNMNLVIPARVPVPVAQSGWLICDRSAPEGRHPYHTALRHNCIHPGPNVWPCWNLIRTALRHNVFRSQMYGQVQISHRLMHSGPKCMAGFKSRL